MRRLLVVLAALAMAACQGPGSGVQPKPATPQSVTLQPGDLPGMQRCATSGDVNTVLQHEKSVRSPSFDRHATEWEQWQRQGATDAYFAVYGSTWADCLAASDSGTGAPRGGLVVGLVVLFKSESVAAANYRRDSTLMGLGPQDIRFIELAGGITTFGNATGLGPESVIGSGRVAGTNYFVAMWQNKRFETDFLSYDVSGYDADQAVLTMNRRIV